MADRLILHIGPRKTGTSYLQDVLWRSRDQLASQGYWLPLGTLGRQTNALSRGRAGWWSATGDHEELWARLCGQVRDRPGTAVVSTEIVAGAPMRALAPMLEMLGDTRIDVVFGVRALSRSIPAEWQQWVRAQHTGSYDDWLVALRDDPTHGFWYSQDPSRIVRRWSDVVPLERISAVIVPGPTHPATELWWRFCAAIGADPVGFELPSHNVNESLGVVQAELLRRVNAVVDPSMSRLDYVRRVRIPLTSEVLLGAEGARKVVLPQAHVDWVTEASRVMKVRLEESGVRVCGDPDELLMPPDPGEATDHEPMDVGAEELISESARVIRVLLDVIADRERQLSQLRDTGRPA